MDRWRGMDGGDRFEAWSGDISASGRRKAKSLMRCRGEAQEPQYYLYYYAPTISHYV